MNNKLPLKRRLFNIGAQACVWVAALAALLLVVGILGAVLIEGLPQISWSLLTSVPSVLHGIDGILPFLLNTVYIVALTILIVLPLGVGAAVYLNEYASNKRMIRVIEFATETLSGIPSIIYGLVGMLVFCEGLNLQTSLFSGCLTLTVMVLPTILRTTQESLKTVPQSYREGALGLGARKWHIVRTIVLPQSLDGIVSGCILAIGRIVGESAALLYTAGCAQKLLLDPLRAYSRSGASLSVALYLYAAEESNFEVAWAIAAVLLLLVLVINSLAKLARRALKRK